MISSTGHRISGTLTPATLRIHIFKEDTDQPQLYTRVLRSEIYEKKTDIKHYRTKSDLDASVIF